MTECTSGSSSGSTTASTASRSTCVSILSGLLPGGRCDTTCSSCEATDCALECDGARDGEPAIANRRRDVSLVVSLGADGGIGDGGKLCAASVRSADVMAAVASTKACVVGVVIDRAANWSSTMEPESNETLFIEPVNGDGPARAGEADTPLRDDVTEAERLVAGAATGVEGCAAATLPTTAAACPDNDTTVSTERTEASEKCGSKSGSCFTTGGAGTRATTTGAVRRTPGTRAEAGATDAAIGSSTDTVADTRGADAAVDSTGIVSMGRVVGCTEDDRGGVGPDRSAGAAAAGAGDAFMGDAFIGDAVVATASGALPAASSVGFGLAGTRGR